MLCYLLEPLVQCCTSTASSDSIPEVSIANVRPCTVSRSPRLTVTPRSRVPTPSSEGTTGMLCTAPCAPWCAPPIPDTMYNTDNRCRRRSRRASATRHKERTMMGDGDGFPFHEHLAGVNGITDFYDGFELKSGSGFSIGMMRQ